MPDHAIVSIAYKFHRVGTLLSSYRVEYMEDLTFPVDLTLITHKGTFGYHWNWMSGDLKNNGAGACLEEVDPTTPEAQKQLLWDRPLNRGGYALSLAEGDRDCAKVVDEQVYRVTHDLFEIVSHDIHGLSNDLGCSCGLEWEEEGIGFEEIITDCNYPKTYHTSTLAEIIRVAESWSAPKPPSLSEFGLIPTPAKEPKDEGHLLFLYSWDGHLDSYTHEFDSYWEYIGPITDADLAHMAHGIARQEQISAAIARVSSRGERTPAVQREEDSP